MLLLLSPVLLPPQPLPARGTRSPTTPRLATALTAAIAAPRPPLFLPQCCRRLGTRGISTAMSLTLCYCCSHPVPSRVTAAPIPSRELQPPAAAADATVPAM